MRTVIVTIAAALFSLSVAAHNPGVDPANYCVKSKNGKMIVERNGTVITKEIKFKDGTRIKPNGTVYFTTGKTVKLKEGECVNENTIMNLSQPANQTSGDEQDWDKDNGNCNIQNNGNIQKGEDLNKLDSTKTDETLDPDRYKNDGSNVPQKGESDKELNTPQKF
jgi:hypothetical protein